MAEQKRKHAKHVRRKGRCACGMRRRSLKNLNQHAAATGHKLDRLPGHG